MLRRPCVADTEDDLLKQQLEYHKSLNKSVPTQAHVTETTESHASVPSSVDLIGNIIERKTFEINYSITNNQLSTEGFPAVFKLTDSDVARPNKKKKSLFAQKMEDENAAGSKMDVVDELKTSVGSDAKYAEIHEENTMKIKSMSNEEIEEEKRVLESTLSPTLLQFLKERGKKRTASEALPENVHKSVNLNAISESEIRENITKTVDQRWLEMDRIELEKLSWIGDIPDAKSLETNEPYSARFDFAGNLQPFQKDVDVREALHHHGEEHNRPGYTIQELYQLCRSTVLQQRNIALATLGNIILKTKSGYYDSCFDGALLRKLVESDLFFLLRFAMDDRASTTAAVHCLYELFVNRSDEVCLDRLRNVPGEREEPYLYVSVEVNKETEEKEEELKDHEIIAQDLVRGILRTDLFVRFAYILNNFDVDVITVQKIFDILIRVCRHSPDAGQQVLQCDSFVEYLFKNVDSSHPLPEAVKLIRVIANNNNLARVFIDKRKSNFQFVLKCLDSDEPVFKLKLECLLLWSTMLRHGLLMQVFPSFSSNLKRLLHFYVSTANVDHGRFDFELFSGIVGVLSDMVAMQLYPDKDFEYSLLVCIQKWMTQLISGGKWNFSVAKALGSALNFFVVKFKARGVTPEDTASFTGAFHKTFSNFLNSTAFHEMCEKLTFYSHIRNCDTADRDPENLPSLCSVYKNASDYVKLLQDNSAFPLVHSLIEFLLIPSVMTGEDVLRHQVLNSVHYYRKEIMKSNPNPSWFSRSEAGLLISILKLMVACRHGDAVTFGFRLVPHLRTDDRRVIDVINAITSGGSFTEVAEIYKQYVCKDFKPISCHLCENFPKHWIYEPITAAPKQTLKCLSFILDNCPELIANVPPTLRFVHICLVLLNSDNVFNADICAGLERSLEDVLKKFHALDLNSVVISEKSFYELYRELVNEYASSSYGHPLFSKVVTLPLAQRFDVSFRKLMWSEFMHALRVISLPRNVEQFISFDDFTTPVETDESLLILYLNAVSKNVLMEPRNGFIFEVAVTNIRKYLDFDGKDEKLAAVLKHRILSLTNESLKNRLLVHK